MYILKIFILICLIVILRILTTQYNIESFDNKNYIPIFIIVHDRIHFLKKCILSFKQIKTKYKIIIHDVATTYKPTLKYLNLLRKKGYTIYRSEINNHKSVKDSIKTYLHNHPECKYYVLTDHDIILDNVEGDILECFIWLLNKYKVDKVGCSLKISDIPDSYPNKYKGGHNNKGVIKWESQFWKNPVNVKWKNKKINIYFNTIDTTFALYKRDNINPIPQKSIRVGSPYIAKHLDWYINDTLTKDHIYYNKNNRKISHWGIL